jgi:hypothetical protein
MGQAISQSWSIIVTHKSFDNTVSFSVPQSCPTSSMLIYQNTTSLYMEEISDQEAQNAEEDESTNGQLTTQIPTNQNIASKSSSSTSALQNKRNLIKAPMVVSEVRRSERLKKQKQGFKASSCPIKSYICCHTNPPTLSSNVIRSLDRDF